MPILNFLTHKDDYPEGNAFRNTAFMIGHCAFWLLNFLNCSYLILFEGFAFGRLQKNYLSKLSLLACFTQTISCLSSIHRYNINDSMGFGVFLVRVRGFLHSPHSTFPIFIYFSIGTSTTPKQILLESVLPFGSLWALLAFVLPVSIGRTHTLIISDCTSVHPPCIIPLL